jgi:predicted O-linked N-acetylglucosamine transferase (SPINDLY family)
MHYGPGIDRAELFAEHQRWAAQHAAELSPITRSATNGFNPHRRLRIGYVSADFREHPVAHFIGPVLAARDRAQFEVIGYSDVPQPDESTKRLSAQMDEWREISGLSDEALAELVVRDGIDILVDLTGHAGKNRLLAFARKPAPIQVTHFGYPDTTGLSAMDYRMSDAHADPPGETEKFHTEKLVRLPDVAWCYEPSASPPVKELPVREAGFVTFASFNNIPKLTNEVLALWARILKGVPNARLKLLTNAPGQSNERVWQEFEKRGVDRARVSIVDRLPREQYLELHNTVDIGLDPFPYNGAVTSCDALWMGVPVMTLAGATYVARQGVSVLLNLGLADLIAASAQEYVEIAIQLAGDLERLADLRRELRDRMNASAIMDGRRFARNLESAYRRMWQEFIATMA